MQPVAGVSPAPTFSTNGAPTLQGGVGRGGGADMCVIVYQGTCQTQSLKFFDLQRISIFFGNIRRSVSPLYARNAIRLLYACDLFGANKLDN